MNCIICGKEIVKSQYMHKTLCSSECFHIDFWNDCLDESAIIIDGICYHDAGSSVACGKGFDGRMFKIQMHDGRIIETDNLRYNGEVPKERNVKDNAVFMR